MRTTLIRLYLEYFNDYLTIDKMASDKNIDSILLSDMIRAGKVYYNEATYIVKNGKAV